MISHFDGSNNIFVDCILYNQHISCIDYKDTQKSAIFNWFGWAEDGIFIFYIDRLIHPLLLIYIQLFYIYKLSWPTERSNNANVSLFKKGEEGR